MKGGRRENTFRGDYFKLLNLLKGCPIPSPQSFFSLSVTQITEKPLLRQTSKFLLVLCSLKMIINEFQIPLIKEPEIYFQHCENIGDCLPMLRSEEQM